MKTMVLLLSVLMVTGVHAAGDDQGPLRAKLAALKEVVKQETKKPDPRSTMQYAAIMGELAAAVENPGQNFNSEQLIQELLASGPSDAVEKAATDFLDELHREKKARDDAFTASVDVVVKRVPDIVLKATKAADLDSLLADLQHVQQGGEYPNQSGQTREDVQRAAGAYRFVAAWQNYLSDRDAGRIDQARNDLNGLSNDQNEQFVPRSEILNRVNQLATAGTTSNGKPGNAPLSSADVAKQIAEGIKTLDEMAPALAKVEALTSDPQDYRLQRIREVLEQFVTKYDNTKAGMPVSFPFGQPVLTADFDNPKLYEKLLIFLFQHEFPNYRGPAPTEDETPPQFLDSVFADAEQREDWHELQQAILAHTYLGRNSLFSSGSAPDDTRGFNLMLAGINQETAGQYAAAVLSYQQALSDPNTYLPSKFIGSRLDGIQKAHPDEYATGMKLAGLSTDAAAPSTGK